jgi:acetyl esterase
MVSFSVRALAGASILALGVSGALAQNTTDNAMSPMNTPDNAVAPGNTMANDDAMESSRERQEPAPEVAPEVAESTDSGTLQRAHDEMASVIQTLMDLGAKPFNQLSVVDARNQPTPADAVKAVYEEQTGDLPIPEAVARTEDVTVEGADGDIPARVYWPDGYEEGGEPLPVIVYFHGGGWVVATIDTYDASARALANQADAIVVSVEYRKGPEHKFPAAHDDAIAAYSYVVENAGTWNGDSERIAVAGESAGGNMAINVAIAARDQELSEPDAILAVYPVAGNDLNTQSYQDNQNAVPLSKGAIEWFLGNYLNETAESADTRLNLVEADLEGLPPTTIVAAEIDPLLSEGETLRDMLQQAGVDVAYRRWDGVTHEFFGMAPVVPEAKQAQDFAGERLQEALEE